MTEQKWKELLAKEFNLSPICASILYRELLISVQKVKSLDSLYTPKNLITGIVIDEYTEEARRGQRNSNKADLKKK